MVQLRLFSAGDYPGNDKFTAAGVAAKSNLGVEIMVVAGVVLAVVVSILVCCLVAGNQGNEDE